MHEFYYCLAIHTTKNFVGFHNHSHVLAMTWAIIICFWATHALFSQGCSFSKTKIVLAALVVLLNYDGHKAISLD